MQFFSFARSIFISATHYPPFCYSSIVQSKPVIKEIAQFIASKMWAAAQPAKTYDREESNDFSSVSNLLFVFVHIVVFNYFAGETIDRESEWAAEIETSKWTSERTNKRIGKKVHD